MKKSRRATAIVAALSLAIAACGGDDDATESTDQDSTDSADSTEETEATEATDPPAEATSTDDSSDDESTDAPAPTDPPAETTVPVDDCAPLAEPAEVIVSASSANLAFAAVFLAQQVGAFEAEGLDVTIEKLSATDAIPQLGQGRVDVVLSTLSAGTLNAINSGVELKWTAPLYLSNPESLEGLYVQSEYAADAASFDISSIVGGSIASPAGLGGTSSFIISEQLIDAGLTFDDVAYNQLGAPDILIALEQGAVEMGWLSTPFWTEAQGNENLTYIGGFDPDQNGTAMLTGPKLGGRPDVGAAFFRAIGKTIRDHLAGADYLDDPETAQAIADSLELDVADLETPAANLFDPMQPLTGADEFAQRMQTTFLELGGLLEYDEPIASDRIIDTSMVEAARACI
jgi:NitT/TauT family transport system substrate-binding protein